MTSSASWSITATSTATAFRSAPVRSLDGAVQPRRVITAVVQPTGDRSSLSSRPAAAVVEVASVCAGL